LGESQSDATLMMGHGVRWCAGAFTLLSGGAMGIAVH